METLPAEPSRKEILRQTFIERANRPTYDELAAEFKCPVGTIKNYAADESWVALRLAHQEALAQKSDAFAIILRATQIDKRVVESFADVVVSTLHKLSTVVADVDGSKAASTRAQILNTCSFAAKNLGDLCKAIGLVGMPKGMADEGKEANGRWNPQMLSQLNVTVQNIVGKAQAVETPINDLQNGASIPPSA